MEYISTDFGVDSSSTEKHKHRHTDRKTDKMTDITDRPTYVALLASVIAGV